MDVLTQCPDSSCPACQNIKGLKRYRPFLVSAGAMPELSRGMPENVTIDTGHGGFSARALAGVSGDINLPVSED
jgi:hypothetical protein